MIKSEKSLRFLIKSLKIPQKTWEVPAPPTAGSAKIFDDRGFWLTLSLGHACIQVSLKPIGSRFARELTAFSIELI